MCDGSDIHAGSLSSPPRSRTATARPPATLQGRPSVSEFVHWLIRARCSKQIVDASEGEAGKPQSGNDVDGVEETKGGFFCCVFFLCFRLRSRADTDLKFSCGSPRKICLPVPPVLGLTSLLFRSLKAPVGFRVNICASSRALPLLHGNQAAKDLRAIKQLGERDPRGGERERWHERHFGEGVRVAEWFSTPSRGMSCRSMSDEHRFGPLSATSRIEMMHNT